MRKPSVRKRGYLLLDHIAVPRYINWHKYRQMQLEATSTASRKPWSSITIVTPLVSQFLRTEITDAV